MNQESLACKEQMGLTVCQEVKERWDFQDIKDRLVILEEMAKGAQMDVQESLE